MPNHAQVWHEKLMRGATALLYAGPLLAGLSGYGWAVVPLFAMIFGLWLVIQRPALIPERIDGMAAWVPLASRVAVQALLIVGFFGFGRGLGGVAGVLPPVVALLPVALSFLALPLARLVFDAAAKPVTADALVALLGDQPADLPDPDLRARLDAMMKVVPAALLCAALDRALREPGAPLLLRRARAAHDI